MVNWYKRAQIDQCQLSQKDINSFSKELLQYLFKNIKSKGYDIYSVEDMIEIIKKSIARGKNLIELHEDWKDSFKKACESVEKRKETNRGIKKFKEQSPEVDWNRIRELGYTNNIYGAGYITPDGKLIDLSERKHGGYPNVRSLDHREVGGYKGMQALMGLGYARIHITPRGWADIDLNKEPTSQQYNIIYNIANISDDGITFDLKKNTSGDPTPIKFNGKTNPMVVVNKIKEFYNKDVGKIAKKNKTNWYKYSQLNGEWWLINGNAVFADANVGDYNHSGVVIESILAEHDLAETIDLNKENEQSLKDKGLSDEEIDVVFDKKDPREYAMKKWGWIRVQGNNVQTQKLTEEEIKNISNGLWEIDNEIKDDEEINIEVMDSRTYYSGVPYSIINSDDISEIIPYGRKY